MGDPTSAAHLTGTLQTYPSLFELLSVENFSSALHSAINHVVKFVAQRNPEKFGILYRNFDEIFLVLDTALQLQYLKTKRGTLSETFYGLERFNTKTKGERINILPSLGTSVLIPYINVKIKKLYDRLREESSTISWKKRFVKIYPVLTAILGALKLYKYIIYCLGRSSSHDFILQFLGLHVGYAAPPQMNPAGDTKRLKRFLMTLGESVLWVIEIGSFFVQFLEAWSNKRGPLPTSLPVPEFYQSSNQLDKFKCPLCNEIRKNSATLSTSGITYCYTCISKYVQHYKSCPVTNIPSNMDHIIRIFYT